MIHCQIKNKQIYFVFICFHDCSQSTGEKAHNSGEEGEVRLTRKRGAEQTRSSVLCAAVLHISRLK